MDLFLDARASYDNTFNFWNDYLGLSTLVTSTRIHSPPCSPNSITESLKATLGLDDSPLCEEDCCGSIYDLKDTLLRPYDHHHHHHHHPCDSDRDSPPYGGTFPGLDLLSVDRRRKQPQQHPRGKPEPKVCVFCRNNGAPEEVYGTHILKTVDGRVLCPILRAYTCPLCSANGDNAHTIKYCPLSRDHPGQRLPRGARSIGRRLKIF